MKNKASTVGGGRADPEEQACNALRQLRLARNWSQQEVATRMTAYGHDFHQTTIAKIEAAQRPLRVRELAGFAALYGVGVQDLVYAPADTLPELDQEIEDVAVRLREARSAAATTAEDVEAARAAAQDAETANQAALANLTVLTGRLDALIADRQRLRSLTAASDSSFEKVSSSGEHDTPKPESISISSSAEGSPAVLRVLLGSHLRRLRESRGITAEDAGLELHWHSSRIAKFELGRIEVKERALAHLLTLYGVTDRQERLKWLQLCRKSNAPSWWQSYSDVLPSWCELYVEIETAAAEIKIFETGQIPDLLQTYEYSYAVNSELHKYNPVENVRRRVRLGAARRQRLLERSNVLRLQVVLDEAVLHRRVGSEAVMRDQLRHLVEVAKQPETKIQVLPLTADTLATEDSFRILHFSESDLRDVVYLESLTSARYLDRTQEVDSYVDAMRQLTSRALPPEESVLFLSGAGTA